MRASPLTSAISERITRLASPAQHDPWLIETADDPRDNPAIYVEIYTTEHGAPLYWTGSRKRWALQAAMGELPWWSVTGDVTGRIGGGPQVRAFVLALLADGGVAMDDYSDHCWTAEEIAGDVRVDGLAFFDHRTTRTRTPGSRAHVTRHASRRCLRGRACGS